MQNTFDHVSGQSITCGHASIYVEEQGERELAPLFMLHGAFGNMEDFNCIAPVLGRRFRLIGVDSRGHGKSALGAEKLSYGRLASDLALVAKALDLGEINILGVSDGGIVALRAAAEASCAIKKIVTVGSRWEIGPSDPSWGMLKGMTGDIWKGMFPACYQSYLKLNPEPDFARFSRAVIDMWTDLGPDGHPGELLARVEQEILLVRGDKDQLTNLQSMSKLKGLLKNMHFFNIPFADHVAFNDAPEVFLSVVGEFFGVAL